MKRLAMVGFACKIAEIPFALAVFCEDVSVSCSCLSRETCSPGVVVLAINATYSLGELSLVIVANDTMVKLLSRGEG